MRIFLSPPSKWTLDVVGIHLYGDFIPMHGISDDMTLHYVYILHGAFQVWRNLLLLLLDSSAWPCLGSAQLMFAYDFVHLRISDSHIYLTLTALPQC